MAIVPLTEKLIRSLPAVPLAAQMASRKLMKVSVPGKPTVVRDAQAIPVSLLSLSVVTIITPFAAVGWAGVMVKIRVVMISAEKIYVNVFFSFIRRSSREVVSGQDKWLIVA